MTGRLRALASIIAAIVAAVGLVAVTPAATAAGTAHGGPVHRPHLHSVVHTICGPGQSRLVSSGGQWYAVVNSVFGRADKRQCLTLGGGTSYRVSASDAAGADIDQLQASPFEFTGCWDGYCLPHTSFPYRISRIARTSITWDTRQHAHGTYNAALDEWIASSPHPRERYQHANVAELMVWINATMPHYQVGGGAGTELVTAAGHRWYLTVWHTGTATIPGGWAYIQFRLVHPSTRLHDLNLVPLIRLAERRHLLRSSDYLMGDLALNEIWSGGRGLATTRFVSQVTLTRPKRKPKPVHVGHCHDGACRKGGRA
jgi:hypothetical protein